MSESLVVVFSPCTFTRAGLMSLEANANIISTASTCSELISVLYEFTYVDILIFHVIYDANKSWCKIEKILHHLHPKCRVLMLVDECFISPEKMGWRIGMTICKILSASISISELISCTENLASVKLFLH